MSKFLAVFTSFLLIFVASPAMAQGKLQLENGQTTNLSSFSTIDVSDGGVVTIRPASSYSIRVIQGAEKVDASVRGGTLRLRCKKPCRTATRRVIEVSTPRVSKASVSGGGRMTFVAGFMGQEKLTLKVSRGGTIEAFAVRAQEVDATVAGGGRINLTAERELDATVIGSGEIVYAGQPEVRETTKGGGTIRSQN